MIKINCNEKNEKNEKSKKQVILFRRLFRRLLGGFIVGSVVGLSGCAALNTAIIHRNLNVQTKMSKSIFLQPVPNSQKTIYVEVHNTSNQKLDNLKPMLKNALSSQGYRVVYSLNSAHYLLQTNVLQIGKSSKSAAENALTGGFGGALSGAAIGVATGAIASGSNEAIIGGGIIGGVVGTVTNDLVTDTTYTMITDIQISERLAKGAHARSMTTSAMEQGTGTQQVTHLSGKAQWMRYRTRVVSTADKVDLKFQTAETLLKKQLVSSIANIF